MNIRIALLLDLLRMSLRAKYKLHKARAALGHIVCKCLMNTKIFQAQCKWPLHAVLLATTRCNKRCPDCFYTHLVNKPGAKTELSLETVKKAMATELFKSVCRVALVGGEPLLNAELLPIIRHLKSQGVLATLTTNGLLLDSKQLHAFREAGLDWLNISIYDDNRAKILAAFAAARDGAFTVNRMALVFHSNNISEYRQAYAFAVQANTPNLIFNHLYTESDPRSDNERDAFANEFDRLCAEIEQDGKMRLYAHPPYRSTMKGVPRCGQALGLISLAPDETLGPCCHLPPGEAFGTLAKPEAVLQFKRAVFGKTCPTLCQGCYFLHSSVY